VRLYRVRILTNAELLPAAGFTASPTLGQAPLLVTFTDTSAGYVTNRLWNFGDGATTNTIATTVAHTYATGSTNSVTLTVLGPTGSSSLTRTNYILATKGLTITGVNLLGANVLIGFTARLGVSYRVEYTSPLSAPNWQTLADSIPGNGGVIQITDFGGAKNGSRFYRIRQLP
jgi:PKD repeat protein